MSEKKGFGYYRFPIDKTELDFTTQKYDILLYSLASYAGYYNGDFEFVGRNMGVTWGNARVPSRQAYERGRELVTKSAGGIVYMFPRDIFWEFVNNRATKEEYDFVLFRAFQALRTIVGDKQYCKITNEFLIARMCGCRNIEEFEKCYLWNGKPRKSGKNKEVTKYYSRYFLDKLRNDLEKRYNGVKFLKLPREFGVHGYYCTMSENVTREAMARMIVEDLERKKSNKREIERDLDNAKAMDILNNALNRK